MKPKIYTAWFSTAKPDIVGVYQRQFIVAGHGAVIRYSYWNGECWGWAAFSVEQAEEEPFVASVAQHWPWRGLTRHGYMEMRNAS